MYVRNELRRKFPKVSFSGGMTLSDEGVNFLSNMLMLDPKKVNFSLEINSLQNEFITVFYFGGNDGTEQRITAADALQHPWLTQELPTPTTADHMPKFLSRNDVRDARKAAASAHKDDHSSDDDGDHV